MKPICLDVSECNGLGDLISVTPTIRVMAKAYDQKIMVISKMPELFRNNPWVSASYYPSVMNMPYVHENYIYHNSFYNVGKKNNRGIEYKHNRMDIRQFHAINLGFMLRQDEMECEYYPTEDITHSLPDNYIVVHPVSTWPTRTWSEESWIELIGRLQKMGYNIVAIGKDGSETGFFNVEKPVHRITLDSITNLMNKTSVSDCWHIINKAQAVVTMDSGILHLAGTTDTYIFELGSAISPEFRTPYRQGVQGYKHYYIGGSCKLFCSSNMKYGIKEWGDIQGVQPLIKCMENKPTFECHPTVDQVANLIHVKL